MAAKIEGQMRVAQISSRGGPFEIVSRPIPAPGRAQALIKVQACGVCHSDSITKEGLFPFIKYPIVPGHEVAGVIAALGDATEPWRIGQRVGVGWQGGYCGTCEPCRRGEFICCQRGQICGISYDGGYQEYMVAPVEALAAVPDDLASAEAAPLLCAGITTFNALRNSGLRSGDLVAVLGIGGLGHLGVQYAAKMGCRVAAIARGQDKAAFAHELGAKYYIDSQSEDPAQALQKLGGAKVILSTVTSGAAASAVIGGLGVNGALVIVGVAADPLKISTMDLVLAKRSVRGWACGSSIDSEDTLDFSSLTGVRPLIERYPLERAAEGYDRMMSGKARFRVVLEMG